MLLYNQLTELFFTQFLLLAGYEAAAFAVCIFVLKKKLSWKIICSSAVLTLGLSLLSLVIAQGDYSGTTYREQFGWPFWYYTVIRGADSQLSSAIPSLFHFDTLRFIGNAIVWGFLPMMILLAVANRQNKKFVLFAACTLVLFLLLTASLSYTNHRREQQTRIDDSVRPTELVESSSLTPSNTPGWQIYTNATHIFTVRLPEGYSMFYTKDDSQIDFRSEECPHPLSGAGAWPVNCQNYTFLIQKDPIEVDGDGVVKQTTSVAGFPAEQIRTEGGMQENVGQTLVQFQKGDVWYIQTITYHVGQKEEAEETLNTILASFKFTNS